MDNVVMDIQQIRRARLALLIAGEPYKSQAEFIRATGENQGEVSALLKNKSFGERKARSIEQKCGLPSGWLDVEEVAAGGDADQVQRVNDEEARLLTLFRKTDAQGRQSILLAAEAVLKVR